VPPGAVAAPVAGVPAASGAADPAGSPAGTAQLARTGAGVTGSLTAAAALLLAGTAALGLGSRLRPARA
jgi:hypothetical protein